MKVGVLATIILGALIGYPIASFAGLAPDGDNDGIPNVLDKCTLDSRNGTASCDTDQDGYGNTCDADFDQTGTVNATDFGMYFIPAFKFAAPATRGQDMDCIGGVNATDFGMFFIPKFKFGALGGAIPGPSGLACAGTIPCN